MLAAFLAAWLGVLAAQASPGPNLLAVASAALGAGRRAALLVVTGVASGILVWGTAFALGLSALFEASPHVAIALRIVGGVYLLQIGVRALLAARGAATGALEKASSDGARRSLSDRAAWRRGLFVVLTNPKAAMMWAAVSAFLVGSGLSGLTLIVFAPLAALSALAIYGGYALLFSSGGARAVHARIARPLETLFGALFAVLGGRLLLEGLRAIRG